MKITLTDTVKNYEGKPIVEDGTRKNLTLRDVFAVALNNLAPEEQLTPEQKFKVFELSKRIFEDTVIDLTVEDAVLIKERVGIVYSSLIYGRVCEVIDGKV